MFNIIFKLITQKYTLIKIIGRLLLLKTLAKHNVQAYSFYPNLNPKLKNLIYNDEVTFVVALVKAVLNKSYLQRIQHAGVILTNLVDAKWVLEYNVWSG